MISLTHNEYGLSDSRRLSTPASPKEPGFRPGSRPRLRNPRPAPRGRQTRRALTLMEMMLVLAVLVGVAALVWPALQGPLDDQRLLKSADLIRAQWTKARVKAMKDGQLYVFRYVTASDEYAVEPWSGEGDSVEISNPAATTDQTAAMPRSTDEKRHPLGVAGQRLPEGIQFFSGETQTDARSAEVTADGSAASSVAGGPPPIVFYPDGSTSDARVLLTNERFFVQITLRGLTGMVRVSELMSSEELSTSGGFVQ